MHLKSRGQNLCLQNFNKMFCPEYILLRIQTNGQNHVEPGAMLLAYSTIFLFHFKC